MKRKSFLILNWKDIKHSQAGGAELVTHELCKRLVNQGHKVTLLTSQYENSKQYAQIDGIEVIRIGKNRYLHSFQALIYYIRKLRNKFDIIIETVNTAPYFIHFFKGREKLFQFYHQLAREIWYYEASFPLNIIGYFLLEPVATFLQRLGNTKVITISKSTKDDLLRFGFKEENIEIISEGISVKPLESLDNGSEKEEVFTLLYLGSLRRMKRPLEVIKAFNLFVKQNADARLWIAGSGDKKYIKEMREFVTTRKLRDHIKFWGRVEEEEKRDLLQKAHVITVTSVKEGWGLIVTEAAVNGTPAVVYDADGLKDSCVNGKTGIVVENNRYDQIAHAWQRLRDDKNLYEQLRKQAYKQNLNVTFKRSFEQFCKVVEAGEVYQYNPHINTKFALNHRQ